MIRDVLSAVGTVALIIALCWLFAGRHGCASEPSDELPARAARPELFGPIFGGAPVEYDTPRGPERVRVRTPRAPGTVVHIETPDSTGDGDSQSFTFVIDRDAPVVFFPEVRARRLGVRVLGDRGDAYVSVTHQTPPVFALSLAISGGVDIDTGGTVGASVAASPARLWAVRPDVGVRLSGDGVHPAVGASVEPLERLRVRAALNFGAGAYVTVGLHYRLY